MLPDADGVLGWIDLSLYDRYHRVVTHSFLGLVLVALTAALIAQKWPERWLLRSMRTKTDGRPVVSFPVHEYWMDIGRPDDYSRAQADANGEGGL